jgi:hypothetical protein
MARQAIGQADFHVELLAAVHRYLISFKGQNLSLKPAI